MTAAPRIRIDLKSPMPVYRQIVDGVRMALLDGALTPGTSLPSVRQLALDLGVHFNTVGEAYRQLAEEGWLDLRHGRKAIVLDRGTPRVKQEDIQIFQSRLRSLVAEARSKGVSADRIAAELNSLVEVLLR